MLYKIKIDMVGNKAETYTYRSLTPEREDQVVIFKAAACILPQGCGWLLIASSDSLWRQITNKVKKKKTSSDNAV